MLQPLSFLNGRQHERARRWAKAQAAYEDALTGRFGRIASWHYRLGFVHYKQKHWACAERELRAAIALDPERARWHCRLASTLEHLGQFDAAIASLDVAQAKGASSQSVLLVRAACFAGQGKWQEAEDALRAAIEGGDAAAGTYVELADALQKQGRTWQEAEALECAVKLDASNPHWFARLGAVQEAMGNPDRAAAAYRAAIALSDTEAKWHFRLSHVLRRMGCGAEASAAASAALTLDSKLSAKRFGIGAFYQQTGEWAEAAEAYAAAVLTSPTDAELHYRLGLAQDRCYRWQAAAQAYASAVALKPHSPSWHSRLGLVLERQGDWEGAAAAYEVAILQSPEGANWSYRLGVVLHRAGLHEAACTAFLSMEPGAKLAQHDCLSPVAVKGEAVQGAAPPVIQEPRLLRYAQSVAARRREILEREVSSAESHGLVGCDYEQTGDWAQAAAHHQAASLRANTHKPEHYYRLGVALARQSRFAEACEAFTRMRIFSSASGVPDGSSTESASVQRRTKYAALYEDLPLFDDVVLYESFLGATMSCSPLAVFRELRGREECEGWTHVWCLDQRDKAPQEYRNQPDVIFVSRGSDAYLRYLASAKLLVNNVTFPEYFIRKPRQLYLNTWHGTPIKHLGKDINEGILSHKNVTRNFLHATHLVSPNPHTTRVLLERYDLSSIVSGVVAETGYPRIDATLNATPQFKKLLRERLGIGEGQRVVLYAPTWRGTHDGNIQLDLERLERDVRNLRSKNFIFLFRGHHMAEERLAASTLSECTVPPSVDTNELLSIVDVLITDYSSIVFDFLVTGRPVIYYAYDVEEYTRERGLYFPLSELPGEICMTVEAVAQSIERALDGRLVPSEAAYREARARYCPEEDGNASRRVVDLVLHDKRDGLKIRPGDSRKSLLFYVGPLMPNGILTSWKNLVSQLDQERYVVTLVVEPSLISPYPERMEEFEALAPHVQVLGRTNSPCVTLEERWIMGKFHAQHRLASDEMMERYLIMSEREYRRVFGDARFDCVINFEGYNRTWVAMLAGAGRRGARRAIFLHNDMLNEWQTRFPYLEGVFRLYGRYDVLSSVSRLTRDLNRANLARPFGLDPEPFEYCENLQDPDRVLEMAKMPFETAEQRELLSTPGAKFLTLGRLSPEKDHAKLIRAFAKLHEEHCTARLFILGGGPLRGVLDKLIRALGLDKHVFLLGHQANPFPHLAHSDCFVLSSNYEGQPMVLFEAMILDRPIVATNIVGARSVLEGRSGLLVENSEAGLLNGMRKFIEGGVEPSVFDNEEYRARALDRFATRIVGEKPG